MVVCSSNYIVSTNIYTLSLHDALPICLLGYFDALLGHEHADDARVRPDRVVELHWHLSPVFSCFVVDRSEEHTSELQSRLHLVCRLLLEKKKYNIHNIYSLYNLTLRIQ